MTCRPRTGVVYSSRKWITQAQSGTAGEEDGWAIEATFAHEAASWRGSAQVLVLCST